MPRVDFSELPDHGRLWVFPASRDLTEEESAELLSEVDDYLEGWAAHGRPLRSARELRERRFLLIGVDVDAESPSGCSIDALMGRLRELGDGLGLTLIEHAPVWYRDEQGIRTVSRAEFRTLARDGSLDPDVAVFDTTLTRIAALRKGALERPARETWHGKAYFGAHA